jgi:DeoR family transcriptional regulator, suf operon transcriptional repressor
MNSLPISAISLEPFPALTRSTKVEILNILLKQGKITALSLAKLLQISVQAIRRHLKDLELEGLIQGATTQTERDLGRPQLVYKLTELGRDRLPQSYDRFALDLLSTLLNKLDRAQATEILACQWQNKGIQYRQELGNDSLVQRLEKLANLRRAEGYVTEVRALEDQDLENQDLEDRDLKDREEAFIFTEYNCAIAVIANSHPNICTHELEMFSIALPDCEVARTHWMIEGEHRCGYSIKSKKEG